MNGWSDEWAVVALVAKVAANEWQRGRARGGGGGVGGGARGGVGGGARGGGGGRARGCHAAAAAAKAAATTARWSNHSRFSIFKPHPHLQW